MAKEIPVSNVTYTANQQAAAQSRGRDRYAASVAREEAAAAAAAGARKKVEIAAQNVTWNNPAGGYTAPFQANIAPSGTSYDLTPAGTGSPINIVDNFHWTNSQYREEVPRIQLKELKLSGIQQINYYFNNALRPINSTIGTNINNAGTVGDPYSGLYDTKPTGFTYIFPFYNQSAANSVTNWSEKVPRDADYLSAVSDTFSVASPLLKAAAAAAATSMAGPLGTFGVLVADNLMGDVGKNVTESLLKGIKAAPNVAAKSYGIATRSPYAGLEQPMYFSGTSKNTYKISFPLFNTDSLTSIRRNLDFIRMFQFQNLLKRTSVVTYEPPVIYESELAGQHNSMIGHQYFYVSSFVVGNLGTLRSIDIQNGGKKVPIPEAYQIEISLTEMISPSQNIYSSVMSKDGKSVVNTFRR